MKQIFNLINSRPIHREKGFSISEIVVAVGIMGIITSVATMSYLEYLQQGHITALEQNARSFFKATEVCLITNATEDLSKCQDANALKFVCDGCTIKYNPGSTTVGTVKYADRAGVIMSTSSGDCNVCAEYRPAAISYMQKRTTLTCLDVKFCTASTTRTQKFNWNTNTWDTIPSYNTYRLRMPYKKCSSNSDCETGEACHKFNKGTIDETISARGATCT